MLIKVRTGLGTVNWDGEFTDVTETISRQPQPHSGWESVIYKGKRYQLFGGIRTPYFIRLNHPHPPQSKPGRAVFPSNRSQREQQ